jgi:hypothetical protein
MNQTKYPEFWAAFLNGLPLGTLFAAFAFAIIGLILNSTIKGVKRDPMSSRTPYEWSWKFWFRDNLPKWGKSIITTVLVIFVSIRFVNELTGKELSMFYAFSVGFAFDWIVDLIISKTKK